jgi:hypothetical protein
MRAVRCAWIAGAVATFAFTIGAQAAAAEAQGVQTDPKAESPAGVIYQIPLDSARRDAAPVLPSGRRDENRTTAGVGAAGGGSGGSGGGASGSSDSGGGGNSASAGSHAGAGGALSASSGSTGGYRGAGGPQEPSSIHSENGFGSSSKVPGLSQAALRTGAGVAATSAASSTLPTYLLIALVAIAAVGIGLLASRHSRRRDGGQPPVPGA